MDDTAREQVCCEGYGPGGVAIIVTCENARRPATETLRAAFHRHGGRPGAAGSVAYLFRPVGLLRFAAAPELAARAGAAGAEEVLPAGTDGLDLCTDPDERGAVERRLRARGHCLMARGACWRAMHPVAPDAAAAQRLQGLVRELASIEGVRHVYTNAQTTDQFLAPV